MPMGGLTGCVSLGAGLTSIISMDGLIICMCNSMKTLEHMMVPSHPAPNSVRAFTTESIHAVYSTEAVYSYSIFPAP